MSLDKNSAARLAKAHPLLQKLFNAVASKTPIMILDSQRGRAAQELAFRQGHTKVHFGNSAHNWSPSVALDVVPLPLNWKDTAAFRNMIVNFVVPIAKEMNIPIRVGADFNMDGKYGNDNFVDWPHVELHPWREFAKHSKPFEG